MRVVCDNCGASYKIPDSKLTREVNKATCRKCGNPILIRRPDANPAASAAAPAPNTDERTLITSAAELERQVRSRSSASASSYDEGAMDPRPTQISPDNSHTEATVPRDEEAERAAAGFRPMQAPSDAATFVQGAQPSATLIPDLSARGLGAANGGFGAPGFAPSGLGNSGMGAVAPTQQVKGPLPAPATPGVSPQRAAATYEQPAPPPPFGRAAQQSPSRAPTPTLAPAAAPPPVAPRAVGPAPVSIVPSGAPSLVSPVPTRVGHNPSGDLTFALLLSLVSMLGVLLVIANAALGIGALAVFGTFLALFGSAGAALVVLTGARGTKPASVVLSGAGGFFLAFIAALAQGLVSYTPQPEVLVASAPPAAPAPAPVVPKAAEPAAVSPVDPLAALASEPVPVPSADGAVVAVPAPAVPAPAAPVAVPAPVVATPPPKAVVATPAPKATPAPERVTPKATPAPKTTPEPTVAKSTPAPKTTPRVVESTPAPAPKAASLDTRVIDTMIKNNKGVKKCFIVEKGNSGSLPSGVKVKLTVQSSGTVSSARVPSGDWAGTEFDGCVSGAVKAIQFPPFEGDPLTITYPFPL